MNEQIYTYFTLEITYMWINIGVLLLWFILVFFPNSNICKFFVSSVFPILIFSIIYSYLIYIIFTNGYNFLDNFKLYLSFKNLQNLFNDSSFLIIFWTHFLAINLFCGSWIVKDCQKYNVSKILIFLPLLITYLFGPLGILTYWIIKVFYAKKISLYD